MRMAGFLRGGKPGASARVVGAVCQAHSTPYPLAVQIAAQPDSDNGDSCKPDKCRSDRNSESQDQLCDRIRSLFLEVGSRGDVTPVLAGTVQTLFNASGV